MKRILTAIGVIAILASCQKEIDFATDNPGNTGGSGGSGGTGGSTGNTSGMLVKAVGVTGSETQTTLYTYDSQKRLETLSTSGASGGMPIDLYNKYIRDAAGRIVKVLQKDNSSLGGASSDTATHIFHYTDGTTLNFDYSVQTTTMSIAGFSMSTIDSAVYTYTAGKMTSYRTYMFSSLMPGSVMQNGRYDFTYDASDRVTGMKIYSDASNPGGSLDLIADYKYTYSSTSVNNLYLTSSGAQNFALHGLPNAGNPMMSKMEMTSNATATPTNVVITTTFVNGANNKPTTATATAITTGQPTQTTNYTFYYQ